MRFFSDDPSIEADVDWFFVPEGTPRIQTPNVFNSRNWYAGVPGWPLLGEVEGAARPWRDGSDLCQGRRGAAPGTAEAWVSGVPSAQAVLTCPCQCRCQGWFRQATTVDFGAGPQAMTPIPASSAAYVIDPDFPAYTWIVRGLLPGCPPFPRTLQVLGVLTADFNAVVAVPEMIAVDAIERNGSWRVPASSPVRPRTVLAVAT